MIIEDFDNCTLYAFLKSQIGHKCYVHMELIMYGGLCNYRNNLLQRKIVVNVYLSQIGVTIPIVHNADHIACWLTVIV